MHLWQHAKMWLHSPPRLCFSVCIQLHFSLSLSPSISLSLSFCLHPTPNLSVSVSLSLSFYFSVSTEHTSSLHPSLCMSSSISHSWCIYISHSLSPSLRLTPNIPIPPFSSSSYNYLSMSVSSSFQSLSCCISFSRCLSLFVSVDSLVSLRAALWHGEMELVCSCSHGGTLQSG